MQIMGGIFVWVLEFKNYVEMYVEGRMQMNLVIQRLRFLMNEGSDQEYCVGSNEEEVGWILMVFVLWEQGF